jgi:hypothetical protein
MMMVSVFRVATPASAVCICVEASILYEDDRRL